MLSDGYNVQMHYEAQLDRWISEDHHRSRLIEYASSLELNDWCLAAGFVRNLVWDKLHDHHPATPFNDIDLIYFNDNDCSEETDRKLQGDLKCIANYPWSVKNQARMHARNGDAPYVCTADAMSYWVEIETAVGVRLNKAQDLEFVAPFGLAALFNNTITINSKRRKPEAFAERVNNKKWLQRWPKLKISF